MRAPAQTSTQLPARPPTPWSRSSATRPLIQTPAGNVLTDPIYSKRAGPFGLAGPRRVRPPAVRFEDLPPIAVVLLSYNYYDQCDRATLARLARRFDPLVITPLGHRDLVRSTGIRRIEERRTVHMNPDEAVQAHLALGAVRSIGMRFGTFQLTTLPSGGSSRLVHHE